MYDANGQYQSLYTTEESFFYRDYEEEEKQHVQ